MSFPGPPSVPPPASPATQYVVRFDRQADSTGPDAVSIVAERFTESYREGAVSAYQFFDAEDNIVAMVRAARVVYIARAGTATEPPRREAAEPEPPDIHSLAPDL